MELTEQEAHCIARALQGAWFSTDSETGMGNSLDACQYCKYQCYKDETRPRMAFGHIRKLLTEKTGVDLGVAAGAFLIGSEFPYRKFLKNANEEIKEYFRTRFEHVNDW